MLSLVPIDVWIAAVLAGAVVLLAFFGPSIGAFAAIYIGLACARILSSKSSTANLAED